jgi:uncharacterized membrane protein YjgN (DUF898 family)
MDQQQETTLFEFGVDQISRAHLSEAARWAKFLAIFGMVMCGLVAIMGIFVGATFSTVPGQFDSGSQSLSFLGPGLGIFMIVLYIGFAILYFFPCLFLLRFANHMRNALGSHDQLALNTSFQNLKIMFRYVGILTIIVVALYVIGIFAAVIMAAGSAV